MAMKYKFLPHTADIKIQAFGNTLEEAFNNSAMAIKQAIAENIKVNGKTKKTLELKAEDLKSLLYIFLEEFIYLLDAEDFLISEIKSLKLDEKNFKIKATILGDKSKNYKFTNEVKAITYYQMKIEKKKKKYMIQYVLDV